MLTSRDNEYEEANTSRRMTLRKFFKTIFSADCGSTKTLQERKWYMRDMFLEVVVGLMHC